MNKRIQIPDTDLAVCPVGLGTVSAGIKWDGTDADRLIAIAATMKVIRFILFMDM